MGAGRNVEIDDTSGKRSEDLAVGKMEFLEIDGRHRTFALSSQGRLRGSGFIDGVGGRKAVGQEWFQALQGAMGLCNLSIHMILALVCREKSGRIRLREMLGDYARNLGSSVSVTRANWGLQDHQRQALQKRHDQPCRSGRDRA